MSHNFVKALIEKDENKISAHREEIESLFASFFKNFSTDVCHKKIIKKMVTLGIWKGHFGPT